MASSYPLWWFTPAHHPFQNDADEDPASFPLRSHICANDPLIFTRIGRRRWWVPNPCSALSAGRLLEIWNLSVFLSFVLLSY